MLINNTRKTFVSFLILAIGTAWLVYIAYSRTPVKNHEDIMTTLTKVPDFTWQAFDGTSHKLSELDDHPVLIHFWATWCGPCREEFPALIEAANHTDPKTIFLTVSTDASTEKAKKFVETIAKQSGAALPENMLFATDPQKTLTLDLFQSRIYPNTLVLDSSHHLQMMFAGMANWQSPEMTAYLHQLQEPPRE